MAKQGQHQNSAVDRSKPRGHEQSRGRNNPAESVMAPDVQNGEGAPSGNSEAHETHRQVIEHQNPRDPAQAVKNNWNAGNDWNDDLQSQPASSADAGQDNAGRGGDGDA